MARVLAILLVLGLLGGTAAAFVITEGLKLEKSPVTRTHLVNQLFSPTCDCSKDVASIGFQLRRVDTVTATVVTPQGEAVATLAVHYFRRSVEVSWNGRDEQGSVVPDGTYKLRLHLAHHHQTITLPNAIRVETTAPSIAVKAIAPRVFSPDHDGRAEYVKIAFSVSAPARALLYVNRTLVGRGQIKRAGGTIHWYGKAHGKPYRPGVYRLSLRAEDQAGNVSAPTRAVSVRLRYIALARNVIRVRPGARFAIRVSSDAEVVRWLLHGKTGESAPGTLRLRAPKKPGQYRLFVTSVGRAQVALVVVSKR